MLLRPRCVLKYGEVDCSWAWNMLEFFLFVRRAGHHNHLQGRLSLYAQLQINCNFEAKSININNSYSLL